MADVTQVAANVRLVSESSVEKRVQYGEAVEPGEWLRQDTTDRKYYRAQNDVDAEEANVVGMNLTYGAANTYGYLAVNGAEVNVGATLAAGENYALSNNLGNMAPEVDVITGRYLTNLGYGLANGNLKIAIDATGVTHA